MQQLNAYRFYELASKLHGLFCSGAQGRVTEMFVPLTEAQTLLDSFIKGDVFALETSKIDANRLLNKIGAVFNRYYIDASTKQLKTPTGEDTIDSHELSLIRTLIEKFEHALAAELNRASTYVADKRGIYSTHDLAENAQNILSETLRRTIPAMLLHEVDLAGRALAFGLGTAATVHLLRAVESMLKIYFESFAGNGGAKSERNYSIFLKKLSAMAEDEEKTSRPDRRVVQMLSQIKDHYRNPLLSPENSVTIDEATQLFGMASALISLMAEQVNSRKQAGAKGNEKNSGPSTSDPLGEEDDEAFDYRLSQAG